jgi:toxin ParE1/3/4
MACQIFVTELANDDLAKIVMLIARDNPPAAQRFGFALLDKIKLLADHPELGRMVPERSDPALREILLAPYRIVYRYRELEQRVEVLRIWHGARQKLEMK